MPRFLLIITAFTALIFSTASAEQLQWRGLMAFGAGDGDWSAQAGLTVRDELSESLAATLSAAFYHRDSYRDIDAGQLWTDLRYETAPRLDIVAGTGVMAAGRLHTLVCAGLSYRLDSATVTLVGQAYWSPSYQTKNSEALLQLVFPFRKTWGGRDDERRPQDRSKRSGF